MLILSKQNMSSTNTSSNIKVPYSPSPYIYSTYIAPYQSFFADILLDHFKKQNPNVDVPDCISSDYEELKKWIDKNKPEQRHP